MAVLHLELLRGATSRAEITDVLDAGSAQDSLNAIYEQTVMRVRNENKDQARLGMVVLKWVWYTGGRLGATALLHALAMDPTLAALYPGTVDDNHLRPEKALTIFFASLVTIEPITRLVRFKHYTAQQYFDSNKETICPDIGYDFAKAYLRYLQLGMLDQKDENDTVSLFKTPLWDTSLYDNNYNRLGEISLPIYPLLELIDKYGYTSLLVVLELPAHLQDDVLRTFFTYAPIEPSIYRKELGEALRMCLDRMLNVSVVLSGSTIKSFID